MIFFRKDISTPPTQIGRHVNPDNFRSASGRRLFTGDGTSTPSTKRAGGSAEVADGGITPERVGRTLAGLKAIRVVPDPVRNV